MKKLAKIVATVGPASASEDVLEQLFDAGADVVRLNLSHGTHDTHREVIRRIRRISRAKQRFIPIIADLMGPRFRLGPIDDGPRMLEEGDEVQLGASSAAEGLPVEDPSFLDHLREGERILIDNGLVELEIISKGDRKVLTRVAHGGPVSTRKGINLPDTDLPFTISDKDRADIAFALEERADYIAVSFVGAAADLEAIRAVVREQGGAPLPLIAKLERAKVMKSMEHLDAITEASDALMVARGDLGVEIPLHKVPVYQKHIVQAGRRQAKPVIVATQMLESMMTQPRPTRAETSDCANAVFDGADALMLSGETAAGSFPVDAVKTMARVISEAEAYKRNHGGYQAQTDTMIQAGKADQLSTEHDQHPLIPDVVCGAAVEAANRLPGSLIAAFSQGGFTARMLARYRPHSPITVITREAEMARRVQLIWGTRPLLMEDETTHHDDVISLVDHLLLENGLAKPGDVVIVLMGDPIADRKLTNLLQMHRIRPG